MDWQDALLASVPVLAASWLATFAALRVLNSRAILDRPNERSSHETPTPRGGGIAVIAVLLIAWALIAASHGDAEPAPWLALAGALVLAATSWLDDLRGLPAAPRLAVHAVAVALGLVAFGEGISFSQGLLPPLADRLAAGLLWLWFLNLFNFMDGIDGIAGTEAACLGAGVALAVWLAGGAAPLALYGLSVGAAALGFLAWNWQPARVFLGDVGSVPLGYLLGWLLLATAAAGAWPAALILPLYYLADASITLVRRLARAQPIWRAHREHFYQLAVRRGASHGGVVRAILVANLFLIALAAVAVTGAPLAALGGGVVVVALLLLWLVRI